MKKAKAMNCASKRLRVKMPFTAATNGSLRAVMKPQAKNRQVTIMKALVTPRLVRCCTLDSPLELRPQTDSETAIAQGRRERAFALPKWDRDCHARAHGGRIRTFRQVHIQPCSRKWKKALVHVNILNFCGFRPKLAASLLGAATAMLLTAVTMVMLVYTAL